MNIDSRRECDNSIGHANVRLKVGFVFGSGYRLFLSVSFIVHVRDLSFFTTALCTFV